MLDVSTRCECGVRIILKSYREKEWNIMQRSFERLGQNERIDALGPRPPRRQLSPEQIYHGGGNHRSPHQSILDLVSPSGAFGTPSSLSSLRSYTPSWESVVPEESPSTHEPVQRWINESSGRGAPGFRDSFVDAEQQVQALQEQVLAESGEWT